MAHALDFSNGRANLFVAGTPAWRQLGVIVSQAQTNPDAIRLAGLD